MFDIEKLDSSEEKNVWCFPKHWEKKYKIYVVEYLYVLNQRNYSSD